ncbi:hypothetical protein RJ639_021034 [Escallonia herrerae]|uniref:Uncharacterized protein n=1 Tax=Escallonia herrerae TaxID=1293975 RepID=A0AA88V4T9_9ASTE|nr:hypothetical protein RJ639_021034 [Escallonia herrerae]
MSQKYSEGRPRPLSGRLRAVLHRVNILQSWIDRGKGKDIWHVLNPTGWRSPHKIFCKKLIGEKVAHWYLHDIKKDDPLVMVTGQKHDYALH